MALVRWRFEDFVTGNSYVFEVNPKSGGEPKLAKTITYQATAAADGQTVMMEGRDATQQGSFSGVLLTQEQYEAFELWFNKRHQIRLTDDLNRQFWIYITEFAPVRRRNFQRAWLHDYTVSYTILSRAT